MNPNFVRQWRAELIVNESRITLSSTRPEELRTRIARTLGNPEPRFETIRGTTLVYHTSYAKGEEPMGWLVEFEVPESMSLETERRVAA